MAPSGQNKFQSTACFFQKQSAWQTALVGVAEAVLDGAVSELDIPFDQDRFLQNAEIVETTLKSMGGTITANADEDYQLQATCFTLSHQMYQLLQSAKVRHGKFRLSLPGHASYRCDPGESLRVFQERQLQCDC